jgi:hypothetical protein
MRQKGRNCMRNTQLCTLILAGLLACFTPSKADAAVAAYEGFSYPGGTNINGAGGAGSFGFVDNWQVSNDYSVASGSLPSPTGTLSTTGNSLSHPNPVQGHVLRTLSSPLGAPGTTAYFSFLLRPDGTLGQGVANGYFGIFLQGTGTSLFMGKPGTSAAANYDIESEGGGGPASSSVSPVVGQSVFIVVRATFTPGIDTFQLYLNPAPGAPEPLSPNATKSDSDVGTLTQLGIDSGGAFSVDEIRIGSSFADVSPVPEPSSCALLTGGLIVLARRRNSVPRHHWFSRQH